VIREWPRKASEIFRESQKGGRMVPRRPHRRNNNRPFGPTAEVTVENIETPKRALIRINRTGHCVPPALVQKRDPRLSNVFPIKALPGSNVGQRRAARRRKHAHNEQAIMIAQKILSKTKSLMGFSAL